MGALIHSPSASNSETSTADPCPDVARERSAVRTPEYAYIPAAMSATEIPTREGVSGVPVIDVTPASACTSMSYAFLFANGPDDPYPVTAQTMRRGYC